MGHRPDVPQLPISRADPLNESELEQHIFNLDSDTERTLPEADPGGQDHIPFSVALFLNFPASLVLHGDAP
jgi:hypothetical protein